VRRTLEERLRQVVKTFVEEQGMAVDLHVTPGQPIGEPPEICEQVVRVVQEALTNAHKHAAGSRVTVTLAQDDTQAQVRIQDDGPGFNVPAPASEQHHFGLKVMAARAQRIHGDLRVESVPGQGTTITLRWPKARGEDRRRADAGAAGR
jgi:two-component system nitrate/nitrite sensor histidine kinase NarX